MSTRSAATVATAETGMKATAHSALVYITTLSSLLSSSVHGIVVCTLALFNEVNRHWARIVLGWVTVYGQVNHLGIWPAT